MGKRHKHADLISQWANGAAIQFQIGESWVDLDGDHIAWNENTNYRVRPKSSEHTVDILDGIVHLTVDDAVEGWEGKCSMEIDNIGDNPVLQGSYWRLWSKEELLVLANTIREFAERVK